MAAHAVDAVVAPMNNTSKSGSNYARRKYNRGNNDNNRGRNSSTSDPKNQLSRNADGTNNANKKKYSRNNALTAQNGNGMKSSLAAAAKSGGTFGGRGYTTNSTNRETKSPILRNDRISNSNSYNQKSNYSGRANDKGNHNGGGIKLKSSLAMAAEAGKQSYRSRENKSSDYSNYDDGRGISQDNAYTSSSNKGGHYVYRGSSTADQNQNQRKLKKYSSRTKQNQNIDSLDRWGHDKYFEMESIASAGNNSNNNNNNNNNNHRNKYHDDREQDYRDENVNVNYLNANKSSSKGNERRNQRHGNLKKEYTNTKNVENQEQQNSNHAHAFAFSNRSSSNKSNEQQRNTNTNNHNGKQRNNTRKKKKGKKPVQHHVRVSNDPIIYNVKSHTSENDHHYNYDDTIPTEVEVARKIIQTGHLSPAPSSVTTHTRCSRASSPESNVTTNAAGAALLNRLNVTTNVGTCNTNRNMNTNACKQHYKAAAAAVLSQSQSSSGYDDVGMLQFVSQQHQPRASADADAGIVITGESSNNTSATAFLRPQPIMYSSAGVQTQTQVYTHNFEAHIPTIPALAPAGVEGYAYSHPAAAASTAGSNNVAFSTVPSGNSSIVSTSGAMMRAAVYAPDFVPIHYEYAAPNGTVFYAQAAPLHPPQPQSFYVPVARHPYGGGDESTTGQHSQNLNPSAQEWVPPGAGAK